MENLSKAGLQWNKMLDLWVEKKLESPYSELIEYSGGINGEGHYMHFDNVSGTEDLKVYVATLMTILPEPLKSNIELAYKTYIINPDDMDDENVAILFRDDRKDSLRKIGQERTLRSLTAELKIRISLANVSPHSSLLQCLE